MALEKAPHWTDLYYHVISHYFWRPQAIGRKSDPEKPSRHWNYWREKLQSQETPLNHILDFLFHIAPQELLDRVGSALLQRPISGLQLVAPTKGTLDNNIVQPDVIVSNSTALVFIEMKVDSQSSVDQFTKYAIAAHCILQDSPEITSVDLVILSRHTDHARIWKKSKKLGISSERALREIAVRGLEHDPTVWGEKGVKRFMKLHRESIPQVVQQVRSIGVHLADYTTLQNALRDYAAKEVTVDRLIEGVLEELRRRTLVSP